MESKRRAAEKSGAKSTAVPLVDVAGIGLNATDTLIHLPHFPNFDSKLRYYSKEVLGGGQTATAMIACRRWGLRARYVGAVGDDTAGDFQEREMRREGVEAHWLRRRGVSSQDAYILVDSTTGERTILWNRDDSLAVRPDELRPEWFTRARLVHVDGHDTAAAAAAAGWARAAGIPVTADVDNLYSGIEKLLANVDYLISSEEFPARMTGTEDLPEALVALRRVHGCRVVGATLGKRGVLAWDGRQFHYHPAFQVVTRDTTGAGDVFHGAFAFALVRGYALPRALEFSCAAAALNCTAPGARGGIRPVAEIEALVRTGERQRAAYDDTRLKRAVRGAAR
jgi:sugar/nucleoside kinase (ribokinase family)